MAGVLKYDSKFHCEDLAKRRSLGQLDCEIFAAWDISRNCFYKWLRDHEEFKEAHERSQPKWEASWVSKGVNFMEEGNDKAFRYWIAVMNNKAGWAAGTKNAEQTQVNIQNMNVIHTGSKQELISYIKDELMSLNILLPEKQELPLLEMDNESSEFRKSE
jgi:hypothetical protein